VLQTIIDVASIMAGGGLVVAVLKMIPETEDIQKQRFILQYSLKWAFVFSVGVFVLLNLLSVMGLLSSDPQINSLFLNFSVVLLVSPVSLIMVRYFQSLEQFKRASAIQFFTKSFSVFLIIFFTYHY